VKRPSMVCHGKGGLPFWTPAERAGLKAMGFEVGEETDEYQPGRDAAIDVIRAYIKAARAVKEVRHE
jgi:hypothetical protein